MLTRRSVMSRPCLSRRRMIQIVLFLREAGEERATLSVPFQVPAFHVPLSGMGRKREAQAFPPQTLVLAFSARRRHDRPVYLRAESGRNLPGHYRLDTFSED